MSNCVDDLNNMTETKAEIKKRLDSFEHVKQNIFLCARSHHKKKQFMGTECDCDVKDVPKGQKGCGDNCINRLLMMECPNTCSLGNSCSNKRFQNIENSPVEVFKTAYKGVGLRAIHEIQGESFIMEYVGEVLDENKFRKRAKKYSKDDVAHFYFMALNSELVIDASNKGNISRFINHSCNPNAETQKWTVNGELRIGFFSKRTIAKGEEITFDYKYERYGQVAQKCYCGAENCRGWLGGNPDEDEEEEVEEEELEDSSSSSSEEEEVEPPIEEKTQEAMQNAESDLNTSDELVDEFIPDPVMPIVKPLSKEPKKIRVASPLPKARKIKTKSKLKRKSPRKIKNFEADDYEEDLDKLKSTGIRTKAHTLELCRRMFQTTDLNLKLILCDLLKGADSPCKKLFIDYRGLFTFGHWVTDLNGSTDLELNLMETIEDVLAVLTIPDKQVLTDTKLWQTITTWASEESSEEKPKEIAKELADQSKVSEAQNHAEDEAAQDQIKPVERKIALETFAEKRKLIRDKAVHILESWSTLQEVKFKIPKNVRATQRAQHEAELDQALEKSDPIQDSTNHSNHVDLYHNHSKPWSYFERTPMTCGIPDSPTTMLTNVIKPPPPIIRYSNFYLAIYDKCSI